LEGGTNQKELTKKEEKKKKEGQRPPGTNLPPARIENPFRVANQRKKPVKKGRLGRKRGEGAQRQAD